MTTPETENYLTAFGLSEPPFSKELPDEQLWLPPSKQGIVNGVRDAVKARASVVITGDPGVGKTVVLRAVRHLLPEPDFRLTYCHNATLGRRDFYRQLCVTLGLTPSATAAGVFYGVASHIEQLAIERAHPVFLLDEAHLLRQDTLEHLHILMNYEWDSRALLSLVLVGLPELADRLALRRNRSLYSRLHHRFVISPLTPDDTATYVRTRLARAGCDRELFTSDALVLLHEATRGAMRDIDRISTISLRLAARRTRRLIERDLLLRVIEHEYQEVAA